MPEADGASHIGKAPCSALARLYAMALAGSQRISAHVYSYLVGYASAYLLSLIVASAQALFPVERHGDKHVDSIEKTVGLKLGRAFPAQRPRQAWQSTVFASTSNRA